jgi:hypothetical protein
MKKTFLLVLSFIFCFMAFLHSHDAHIGDPIVMWGASDNDVARMPLVQDGSPRTASLKTDQPLAQRGVEFRRFLSPSVKIRVSNASGSGTIIYYDKVTKEAYVASCGHLWNGTRLSDDLRRNPVSCEVVVWYHNNIKLKRPKVYNAQVLFWSNDRGYDTSLLKFKTDWNPSYFPIAPKNHLIPENSHQHSTGCDDGSEVAHYDVVIDELRGVDLITKYNSPRPGRSGGGLLDDAGYYIGTCWGTSNYDGSGIGYFTPLSAIHKIFNKNGYGWLLDVNLFGSAREIRILDRFDFDRRFPKSYIPIPSRGMSVPLGLR